MKFNHSPRALAIGLSMALAATAAPAFAQMSSGMDHMGMHHSVMVGGAAMYPSRNIVQNAIHSKDHTTLVAAVKAAGLVKTLEGPGPFTVFAPTNEAFAALPAGTVQTLLKPENKTE
ncbi:MAG: fasciclin domain-containing protein, partial [Candidatus Angelobacter sp.]